jgi:hypothetical protein
MFPSVNTYGDFSSRLPERLRDARDVEYGGTEPATTWKAGDNRRVWPRISDLRPAQVGPECDSTKGPCHPGEREGFPGFDTFFREAGHDNRLGDVRDGVVGAPINGKASRDSGQVVEAEAFKFGVPERNTDDPARYANQHVLEYAFALKDFRGPASSVASTQILGPWLPKNFIKAIALNPDVANPLRGRVLPNVLSDRVETSFFGFRSELEPNYDGYRFYEGASFDDPVADPIRRAALADGFTPTRVDPRDKFIEFIQMSGDDVVLDVGVSLFRNIVPEVFGGDFSGVVPCVNPKDEKVGAVPSQDGSARAVRESTGAPPAGSFCVRGAHRIGEPIASYQEGLVARLVGGTGENPFRPAPDVPSLGADLAVAARRAGVPVDAVAQGSYLPSRGLQREIARDQLDSLNFNFTQVERSFNRGASQQRTKEVKEAYFDIEMLDSRLWMRLGLQNIVWGKTELFRTTDQFNPQDLALASLPSLEESRIALWSARFVYSLYDVGVFEDVRLEVAFNFDKFEPADLGACGEPYTPDVVCTLTNGIFAHGALGVGVAGIDRPENPWNDISALEIGGRIEWRWDRFSFALTDFYGYSDTPFTDAIFYFERNVDPSTGRPLAARLVGEAVGSCARAGEVAPDHLHGATQGPGVLAYSSSYASHPLSMTPGAALVTDRTPTLPNGSPGGGVPPDPDGDEWFAVNTIENFRGGVGRDPGCLRPGGAPGEPGAFRFDPELLQQTNSLYNHHANQQIFAWTCSSTIGIGATLDPGTCAWTIFASPEFLNELIPTPFSELIAAVTAGDQNGFTQSLLEAADDNLKLSDPRLLPLPPVPLKSTNALFNDPRVICPAGTTRLTRPLPDRAEVCAVDPAGDLYDPVNLQAPTTAPFDRNNNGLVDVAGCPDEDPEHCDLGGFDGVRTLTDNIMLGLTPTAANIDTITPDQSLTNEQRALLGCGPFWGTRCDTAVDSVLDRKGTDDQNDDEVVPLTLKGSRIHGRFGGLDFLNMEASVLEQSWPGVEGTLPGHFATDKIPQPGTVGFQGGPLCTLPGSLVKLPGCRGIQSLRVSVANPNSPNPDYSVVVEFEPGYLPSVDGCVIGTRVRRSNGELVNVSVFGGAPGMSDEIELCNQASTSQVVPGDARLAKTCPIGDAGVADSGSGTSFICDARRVTLEELPLIHPLAGCIESPVSFAFDPGNGVPSPIDNCAAWYDRNVVDEFLGARQTAFIDVGGQQRQVTVGCRDAVTGELLPVGTPCAQMFQNELAAPSWNFMLFLVMTSCNKSGRDLDGLTHGGGGNNPSLADDKECFVSNLAQQKGRCSYVTPQLCRNVKGFFSAAGVTRNTIRAGGNGRYGRRTFIWHSGGELVLRYEKRNVLGFSTDFAEDRTKTNWSMEFTWMEGLPFADNDSPVGVSSSDAINLTVSVDRPTFINFLNPNRTFFFNSQWFFNYLTNYQSGFTSNGPVNVLFTFAVFTGYYQDRVMPNLTTVYDFRSRSGGILPSLQYRFTESFSVTVGMLYFFGRTQLVDMPVRDFGPTSNRVGENAYKSGVDNLLSLVRKRDELFLRLRWTF